MDSASAQLPTFQANKREDVNCMGFVFGIPGWLHPAPTVFNNNKEAEDYIFGKLGMNRRTQGGIEAIFWGNTKEGQLDFHWAVYTDQGWAHKRGSSRAELIPEADENQFTSDIERQYTFRVEFCLPDDRAEHAIEAMKKGQMVKVYPKAQL